MWLGRECRKTLSCFLANFFKAGWRFLYNIWLIKISKQLLLINEAGKQSKLAATVIVSYCILAACNSA
jgi:hypothetical protein